MKLSSSLSLSAMIAATTFAAHAADIIFTFDGSNGNPNGQTTFSETVSGVTLTISNADSSGGLFAADSDGLVLSSDNTLGPTSFQMSFSSAVQVTAYSIGAIIDPTTGTFTLSRTGGSSSGNALSPVGSYPINGTFTATANQTITLTSNPSGSPGWSQIKTFTVSEVPEPVETAAVVTALCGVAALIIRQRRSK